jgi:diadenosine tetraphosphate (Ap4A) HIT family hydrolase
MIAILKFAPSKPGGWMVWFILRYFPFLIPFKKLYQDRFIISIFHPVPCYKNHILLIPRMYLPNFLAVDTQTEAGKKFVHSVYQVIHTLLVGAHLTNFQLLINGGEYQDVRLLHMHLIENEFDLSKSELIHADNNPTGLSELLLKAKSSIQKTKYSAYRLLFSLKENRIKLELQIK